MTEEYIATDEQVAAMRNEKALLGNVSYQIADRYLIMNYPDLFDNTGDSLAIVRMNWAAIPMPEQEG